MLYFNQSICCTDDCISLPLQMMMNVVPVSVTIMPNASILLEVSIVNVKKVQP